MRILIVLPALMMLSWAAARAAEDPNAPYRPSPRVLLDPPAWYSPALFTPKSKPQPGDWMAAHPEPAQSLEEYVSSRPVRPTVGRHTIVLAPLGPMQARDRERLGVLGAYLELFYTLPVRIGSPLGLEGVTSRERSMGDQKWRQYLTLDILNQVLAPALPRDALCFLGVTMEDLYPEPSWNYVFGQASLGSRVGVYSLVRFYPAFWGSRDDAAGELQGLHRSLRTLVHETGHMFGVTHCQKYDCVINGSNSLPEADRQPLHLCPECLKKFRWNIGFDIVARYEGLRKFYEAHGMTAQAEWAAKRIRECRGEKAAADAERKAGEKP